MRPGRAAIVHNRVGEGDDPSTADVLAQVELVEAGLADLGIASERVAVDPAAPWRPLPVAPGTPVFNLIESPPGSPQFHSLAAAALALAGVPYTGSPPAALWLTTDKLATRALLHAEGLPVAPGGRLDLERPAVLDRVPGPWIVKPGLEDASIGLEGDPVCADRDAVLARGAELARRFPGQPVLVETFLEGRELNASLLANGEEVEALPLAEIAYVDFPEGMAKVLGYDAKWRTDSFAYTHTVRRFPEEAADAALLRDCRDLALAAWRACGLAGYGRIDLRLDVQGRPYILEVNANPCLAADAGFLAAAGRAGLAPGDVVGRILDAALRGGDAALRGASHFVAGGSTSDEVVVRDGLEPADREPLARLIRETGFFNAEEVEVALELVDDRLAQGEASHYRFLVAEEAGEVAGYACWGPIPGTTAAADLYWIVVAPGRQGKGVGRALLAAAEERMAAAGRTRVYVETSTRPQYDPTRAFYLACGYHLAAELPDFYAPGDGRATFLKVLAPAGSA